MAIALDVRIDIEGQRDIQLGMTLSSADANAYGLVLAFYRNGQPYDITGYNLTVYARRSGSTTVIPDVGTVQNGKGYYVIKPSMYAYAGETLLEIALTDAQGMSYTAKVLHFNVREGFAASGGAVVDESDYAVLRSLITAAQAGAQQAIYAAEYAQSKGDEAATAVDTHKSAEVLDHPDGSVTDAKIGERTVGSLIMTLTAWLEWIVGLFSGTGGHGHTGVNGDGAKLTTGAFAEDVYNHFAKEQYDEDGSVAIGQGSSAESGGTAVGKNSYSSGGGAVGYNAYCNQGGAVGLSAFAMFGGAIGCGARAEVGGGAVGWGAITSDGFAGGYEAKTVVDGVGIDAIQLGTGTNEEAHTLKVYDTKIVNADGTLAQLEAEKGAANGIAELAANQRLKPAQQTYGEDAASIDTSAWGWEHEGYPAWNYGTHQPVWWHGEFWLDAVGNIITPE